MRTITEEIQGPMSQQPKSLVGGDERPGELVTSQISLCTRKGKMTWPAIREQEGTPRLQIELPGPSQTDRQTDRTG